MIELHEPVVEHHGLFADHDYACPVCWHRPAILQCNQNIFMPCWDCQEAGFKIGRVKGKWWKRLVEIQ